MPPNQHEQNLRFVVEQIKRRLKAGDGRKSYSTVEATGMLFDRLAKTNKLDGMGQEVMRLGCRCAIADNPNRGRSSGASDFGGSTSEALLRLRQRSFNDFDADWLDEEVALNEGVNAVRMLRRDCQLAEFREWIDLKRKKGSETIADADRGQALIDMHPEWEAQPYLTAEQIVGATLIADDEETA